MGNNFSISVAAEEEAFAYECIDAAVKEIQRIEKLLTTFDESSQTNLINKNAGIQAVNVDKEVFDIIERSIRISALTQGAFDISYGSIDKRFWNFDKTMTALPDKEAARLSVRLINYKNIALHKEASTVFLKEKGMRIGFGGIGKGYAAERAKELLKSLGIKSGVVNASGDLTTWGLLPNGKPWTIGIANPDDKNQLFSHLEISDMAIATSGNYEKYVIIDGEKYSHTINPKTGFPVKGIKSVTVICANAEVADALATPITVMGVKAGLYLVNQLKGVECIIIDDNNQLYISDNIKLK
jgi:thiamine biosynthesis lipoprotein